MMLKDLALDSKAGMLNGELAYAFGGKLSAKAAFSGLQIAEILGLDTYFPEAALEAKGKAEVEYEKPALRYHGQTALKLSRRGLPQSVLSAGLSIEGNEELLKAVLDTADRTLAAELRYPLRGEPAAALELSANAKDFSFAGLLAAVSGSGNNARTDIPEARLSAALVYTAKRDQLLSGRGSLRVAEVVYALPGDLTVRQARPMNLEMAQGRLIFTDCALLVQDKELRLSGFLDAEQGWRARIAGSMSLSPKLLRVRAIEQLSGLVDLNVDLSGPATAPAAAGTVTLSRGALSLGAGEGHILLEQLEGQASLDGSSLRLDFLSAKSGAGGINASGSIQNLSSREKRSAEAQVSMDRILVDPLENMSITFGGAVNL
ncbi:MAG TPA: hypothetical protein PLP17_16440, partial [Oligoflexia bacterium]|nr:hypothetical protein [Oligoflexia bacterium]